VNVLWFKLDGFACQALTTSMSNFLFSFSIHHSTCFNRIDLPLYQSKEDLYEKLKLAVTMVATGFDIE
jgi:hypothetical protein